MATAKDARDVGPQQRCAESATRLYTPFCGTDGDDIDWDAYRTLVRYCVGELRTRCCGAPAASRSSGR